MPIYEFFQTNSGGSFRPPAICLLVEADSPEEANEIAIERGVYFDGTRSGEDCTCCGDRWTKASIAERTAEEIQEDFGYWEQPDIPAVLFIGKE